MLKKTEADAPRACPWCSRQIYQSNACFTIASKCVVCHACGGAYNRGCADTKLAAEKSELLATVEDGPCVRCCACGQVINADEHRYGNPGRASYCSRCGYAYNLGRMGHTRPAEQPQPAPSETEEGNPGIVGARGEFCCCECEDLIEPRKELFYAVCNRCRVKVESATSKTAIDAAIRLKVPVSGIPELDAMIQKSRRQDAAVAAMIVHFHPGNMERLARVVNEHPEKRDDLVQYVASMACEAADALLAEADKGAGDGEVS